MTPDLRQKLKTRAIQLPHSCLLPFSRTSKGRGLFPALTTLRCILRLGGLRDAEAFAVQAGNPLIAQWMLNFPSPFPVDLARQRIQDSWRRLTAGEAVSLLAFDKQTGDLVGGVALNNIKALGQPELAYWVTEKRWGQGLGTEICAAMLNHAFRTRGDTMVRASVLADNTASTKLLRKLGFKADGVEILWAEPYAPTVGLSLEALSQHHQATGSALVSVSLNRWIISKRNWEHTGIAQKRDGA